MGWHIGFTEAKNSEQVAIQRSRPQAYGFMSRGKVDYPPHGSSFLGLPDRILNISPKPNSALRSQACFHSKNLDGRALRVHGRVQEL